MKKAVNEYLIIDRHYLQNYLTNTILYKKITNTSKNITSLEYEIDRTPEIQDSISIKSATFTKRKIFKNVHRKIILENVYNKCTENKPYFKSRENYRYFFSMVVSL